MILSAQEMLGTLVGMGLVDPSDVRTLSGDSTEVLVDNLVKQGKLTPFQGVAVLAGRTSELVLGRYVLLEEIATGGMGRVYKALHRQMDRIVALKVLAPARTDTPTAQERFRREVKALARLQHPNIVTAYDADEADSIHFLVMEYIDGTDLARLVRRSGPLPIPQAVDYLTQAAKGLAYAHGQGLVHRDIKPSNLMVDRHNTIKILDLGLARLRVLSEGSGSDAETADYRGPLPSLSSADTAIPELTHTDQLLGTPDYMAPEQSTARKEADQRVDIYSLGCTLYFLLTGRSPAPAGDVAGKLEWHRTGEVPSLSAARSGVDAGLDAVFRRMIARAPQERYPECQAVIEALAPWNNGKTVRGAAQAPRRRMLPLATAVLFVLLGLGLLLAWQAGWFSAQKEVGQSSTNEPSIQWNEPLRQEIERLFLKGVESGVGRYLYSEIDTALATNLDGEWKVGPGMTRDGRGVHVLVRNGLFHFNLLSPQEVQEAGLREKEMFRSVDDKFRLRLHPLVHLSEAHVRVLTGTDGKRQLAVRFHCGVSTLQPLEATALLLEWVAAPDEAASKKLSTHELYTYLSWLIPQPGWHEVSIDLRPEQRLPAAGGTVRVWLTAFLHQPRPSFYRVSEDCIARLE